MIESDAEHDADPEHDGGTGRGQVVALVMAAAAAAAALAYIGWDMSGSSDDRLTGGDVNVRTPASASAAPVAGVPAAPSANPSGRGGGRMPGTAGRPGDSAADRAARQRRDAEWALNHPASRPPATSGVTQDQLDRQRDKVEATVSPVTAINGPVPTAP